MIGVLASIVLLQLTFRHTAALKDMSITIPEAVRIGDTVILTCQYDLEEVALYTIKWYKAEVEFYRFVPKESPPSIVFPIPHITVDISRSNSREVTLTDVTRETEGVYKCEVSADAPLFHTEIKSAKLIVADVPDEGPVLRTDIQKVTTDIQEVTPGASIKATCTTPGSHPAMNVTWFLNDVQITPKHGIKIQQTIVRYKALPGLETVRSTITIKLYGQVFLRSDRMKVRCLATLFQLYRRAKEAELIEDQPLMALVMEPTTLEDKGVRNATSTVLPIFSFSVSMLFWVIVTLIFKFRT